MAKTPVSTSACFRHTLVLLGVLSAVMFVDVMAFTRLEHYTATGVLFGLFEAIKWATFFVGLCVLVGRWSILFLEPIVVFALLNDLLQVYMRFSHNMFMDGDWIGMLAGTSPEEIARYFRCYFGWVAVVGVVATVALIGVVTIVLWRNRRLFDGCRARGVACLVMVLALVVTGACHGPEHFRPWWKPLMSFSSFNLIVDSWRNHAEFEGLKALSCNPVLPRVKPLAVASGAPVGVFVLGESATSSRWALYGYARETTPCMNAISNELVVFRSVRNVAPNTAKSMRWLLTRATTEGHPMDCTLAQVYRRAGYDCRLFSAQERWGTFDVYETFVFSGCSEMRFMSEECSGEWFDGVLLDRLERAVAEAQGPLVVFLHLRGSHFPAIHNYPVTEAVFPPEKVDRRQEGVPSKNVNNYDNTIAYTDKLLGGVVQTLRRLDRPTWMFYVSDHGESVSSYRYRDPADPDMFKIPMVFWASSQYRASAPERWARMGRSRLEAVDTDKLFNRLVDMALIEMEGED